MGQTRNMGEGQGTCQMYFGALLSKRGGKGDDGRKGNVLKIVSQEVIILFGGSMLTGRDCLLGGLFYSSGLQTEGEVVKRGSGGNETRVPGKQNGGYLIE